MQAIAIALTVSITLSGRSGCKPSPSHSQCNRGGRHRHRTHGKHYIIGAVEVQAIAIALTVSITLSGRSGCNPSPSHSRYALHYRGGLGASHRHRTHGRHYIIGAVRVQAIAIALTVSITLSGRSGCKPSPSHSRYALHYRGGRGASHRHCTHGKHYIIGAVWVQAIAISNIRPPNGGCISNGYRSFQIIQY